MAPRRIDIITQIDGVRFQDAYRRTKIVDMAGVPVPVLSLEDLLTNKRASGRLKDRADVEVIEELLKMEGRAAALPSLGSDGSAQPRPPLVGQPGWTGDGGRGCAEPHGA